MGNVWQKLREFRNLSSSVYNTTDLSRGGYMCSALYVEPKFAKLLSNSAVKEVLDTR